MERISHKLKFLQIQLTKNHSFSQKQNVKSSVFNEKLKKKKNRGGRKNRFNRSEKNIINLVQKIRGGVQRSQRKKVEVGLERERIVAILQVIQGQQFQSN